MASVPFFRGQNVVLRLLSDGKSVTLLAKNWTVKEEAAEISDGVNGENRDRLDLVVNSYTATFSVFQTDQEVMQALIDQQDQNDANGLPFKQSGMVIINHRDGTRAKYLLLEGILGPFTVNMSSRQEAVMLDCSLRFRYWKPTQ